VRIKDEETRSIKYCLDSPNCTPIEIQRGSGDIKLKIVQVDNYDKGYHNWTKTRFITYLDNNIQLSVNNERINPVKEQSLFGKLMAKAKLPGDISEYAKVHGIEVPWRDVISSTAGIVVFLTLMAVFVIAVTLTWSNISRKNKIE
jgi:hypothetical protein